jgi:hypothetical protein
MLLGTATSRGEESMELGLSLEGRLLELGRQFGDERLSLLLDVCKEGLRLILGFSQSASGLFANFEQGGLGGLGRGPEGV